MGNRKKNTKEMIIWYNNNICNYFNKDWFDKSIICVNDLFINDTFISLDNLRGLKGIKCNFLEYETLKQKISLFNIPLDIYSKNGPTLPVMLEKISLCGKGCTKIYKILQTTSYSVLLSVQDTGRWESMLNEEVSIKEISKGFYIVHKISKCVYNRYVQFKI